MTTETASYGEWPSPITGADVARNQVGLAFPVIAGEHVWWQESRPDEGGRIAVVSRGPAGVVRNRLGMPWNARTRVHEYGGRSYLPLADGFLFANFADQRVYRCGGAGGDPQPLTPDAGDRLADFVLSPAGTEVWCVRERHSASPGGRPPQTPPLGHSPGRGRITRAIVSVPLDGSAADDDGAVRGGSAGGWTALAAVTSGAREGITGNGVFAAAAAYFGVSDLRKFAAQTHDFESRYLDGLVGPLGFVPPGVAPVPLEAG
jgi:hypothetical protein